MVDITAQSVKDLREKTGAGMMDCKKALTEAAGDTEKAIDILRKKGLKDANKRVGKLAAEGLVFSYIHPGDRVGVMLEVNCETDFVARSEDFKSLVKSIAMHIAWANPRFLNRDSVTSDTIEREKEIFRSQLSPAQEKVADKILAGKLDKFFEENCLLEQVDARQTDKKKIIDLVNELSGKLGEKIEVRRFVRYEVGEGIEKPQINYAEEVAEAAKSASSA